MSRKESDQRGKASKAEFVVDEESLSTELFREIAAELLVPVNPGLDLETQCNLCMSKLIYMDHIRQRAFTSLNSEGNKAEGECFLPSDLELLKQATLLTQRELKEKTLGLVRHSLDAALQKGLYAA